MTTSESSRNGAAACRFCSYLRTEPEAGNIDTPWMRNSHYAALVTVGALVPGWSLICPLDHELNLAAHFQDDAFWQFCQSAAKAIEQSYGAVTVFEHGARYSGSLTGCGTDHAHLHMVPLDFDLVVEAMRHDRSRIWERCPVMEIEERSAGQEYLFVSNTIAGIQTEGLLCVPNTPISQFFRRVIANRIGLSELFDYKRYPMAEIGQSSVATLSLAARRLERERLAP